MVAHNFLVAYLSTVVYIDGNTCQVFYLWYYPVLSYKSCQKHEDVCLYHAWMQVNQYETQAIRESLAAKGFLETAPEQAVDLYVINTCTVTSASDEKSRQYIKKVRAKKSRSNSCCYRVLCRSGCRNP